MRKSDFSTRPGIFGRSNYLIREMLALVEHAEQNPGSASELLYYWDTNAALVRGAIEEASPAEPDPDPEPDPEPGPGDDDGGDGE